jgi:hypothetical protein
MIKTLVFEKNANVFEENCQKSPKIVIITSTPGIQGYQMVYCQTKKSHLGKFWRSCNGRYWYILWPFDRFSDHLVYYMAVWYFLWSFGMSSRILVSSTKKTLVDEKIGI